MPENMYDFLAARGRRDNDLFWANRGKRSSSRLKPNGFIFVMGKRVESGDIKKNSIKPNGFNFLLVIIIVNIPFFKLYLASNCRLVNAAPG
jgi:hypothetical protein